MLLFSQGWQNYNSIDTAQHSPRQLTQAFLRNKHISMLLNVSRAMRKPHTVQLITHLSGLFMPSNDMGECTTAEIKSSLLAITLHFLFYYYYLWHYSPNLSLVLLCNWGFLITYNQTHGRSPLVKWSSRRRGRQTHDNTTYKHKRQNIYALSGVRSRDPSNQAAAEPRLRSRGHPNRQLYLYLLALSPRVRNATVKALNDTEFCRALFLVTATQRPHIPLLTWPLLDPCFLTRSLT
jgi:hypothetical protein